MLELLTRPGCALTVPMRARLDAALVSLGMPVSYAVIDLTTLPRDDVRRGYGSPTVLLEGADLFGLLEPHAQRRSPT